jgi:DNA-binding beta-propeller fold protein YncE
MTTPRLTRRRLVAWSVAASALIGSCNLQNPGVTPPPAAISYPIALALSSDRDESGGVIAPRFLYVANSNFDLRYNAGSLQVFNLDKLAGDLRGEGGQIGLCRSRARLPGIDRDGGTRSYPDFTRPAMTSLDGGPMLDAGEPSDAGEVPSAGDAGEALADASSLLDAGELPLDAGGALGSIDLWSGYDSTSRYDDARGALCDAPSDMGDVCCLGEAEELAALIESQVYIDSFATALGIVPTGASSQRVYVPISSRSRLVYVDSAAGVLQCALDKGRCTQGPGVGRPDDVPESSFPGQPGPIATGTLNDLGIGSTPGADVGQLKPEMTFVATAHELGGVSLFVEKGGQPVLESVLSGFPRRPTSITLDPARQLLYVTSALGSTISRIGVRVRPADASSGEAPDLETGAQGPRELLYETSPIRVTGLSINTDIRDLALDPQDPSRLFALVRGPIGATQDAVAFLQFDPSTPNEARLVDAVRVGAGPSKLQYVTFPNGRSFLIVSCYDERALFIFDAQSRKLESVVRNLSGPHQAVFDGARKLLYLTDFRISVLRVIDLAGLVDQAEPPPRIVATLGSPLFEGGFE